MKKNESKKLETQFPQEVQVLYQKLGNEWYAFSEINGEVFFTRVNRSELVKEEAKPLAKAS